MNTHKALLTVIDMSEQVRTMSHQRNLVQENYEINELVREKSGVKTASLKLQFVQMTMAWIDNLSATASMFVFKKLIPTVKQYNLLWQYTGTKTSERASIKELVDNKILFRTEAPGIFLINPLKIWRGTVFSAIECTKELLRYDKPHAGMVRDLKPSDKYLLRNSAEQFRHLAGDGITPNLLEDDQAEYYKAED